MEHDPKKQSQGLTNTILMIRPHKFRSNQMTIVNNFYQHQSNQQNLEQIHKKTIDQFDKFTNLLKCEFINVIVAQDEGQNDTPDSIFPNNWISFHHGHNYNLYPMFAINRRLQRKIDVFKYLKQNGIQPKLMYDYSFLQQNGQFLQGTGSIVLDRTHKIAYAALSPRTNQQLFLKFCSDNEYQPCTFKAYQNVNDRRQLIYHTNVMMWIGDEIAGICFESIDDIIQRNKIKQFMKKTGKTIIQLTQSQINNFAGNCLMLKGKQNLIIMSNKAYSVLNINQVQSINQFGKIICSDISTIETYGGGSARCMIAQIF